MRTARKEWLHITFKFCVYDSAYWVCNNRKLVNKENLRQFVLDPCQCDIDCSMRKEEEKVKSIALIKFSTNFLIAETFSYETLACQKGGGESKLLDLWDYVRLLLKKEAHDWMEPWRVDKVEIIV